MSNRCLYHATFRQFLSADRMAILGTIHAAYHGEALTTTDEAWLKEIDILQQVLVRWKDEEAHIIFEYDIPRLGQRIDVVLLLRGLIFCLEFKVGKKSELQTDIEQVLAYALDLKDFHAFSEHRRIVPILIPTNFPRYTSSIQYSVYDCDIYNPFVTGEQHLYQIIEAVLENDGGQSIDPNEWGANWLISPYKPTPTIVEAARALYQNHSVENITRHGADEIKTEATTQCVIDIIEKTKQRLGKSICFVTGVPGAGKTLVGLQVAIQQSDKDKDSKAVYLSGNGPLVAVLTEALARDNCKQHPGKNLSESRREVKTFIQIIHRYRDNMLAKIKNPVENGILEIDPSKAIAHGETGYGEVEHVAIFDEAQRSWTHAKLADYLKRGGTYGNKLKVPNFPVSEANFLIWSLDQRKDWAVIVCLVGGGQEIHTGEAGIGEWIKAIKANFPHWNVYISNELTAPEYAEGRVNELLTGSGSLNVTFSEKLHLAVSARSFRAINVSDFVHHFLSFNSKSIELYKDIRKHRYPILLTRNINTARAWLKKKAVGPTRTGILVSKVAARYKPQAVTVIERGDINAIHWFLEDKLDVRSSNYLEDAATEIEVQGLELDYTCVLWDADVRYHQNDWQYYKFNGSKAWNLESNLENRNYMLNAYRVLLTRARKGMIICVPEGNPEDPTRLPEFYDSTYQYLKSLGIEEI